MHYPLWRHRARHLCASPAGKALALSAALLVAWPAAALDVGVAAPSIALGGSTGAVTLSAYQGKLVYLDFWASWCGPCRQSFPWMNAMQEKYGKRGLQVIAINVDTKVADAHAFLAATPAKFMIAFDATGATPLSYGIKGMPSSVLIGRDGKIVYQHSGFRDSDRSVLEQTIQTYLESNP